MTLIKKIKDKKVNFEFNKEYIKVVTDKITNNDALFITNSFKEMHPADAADIIEHLGENDREKLIKLNNFKIDPEVFVELNESVKSEITKFLSYEAIVRIQHQSEVSVRQGVTQLILSDKNVSEERLAIPMLLSVGAINTHLIKNKLRGYASINAQTGIFAEKKS